MDFELSADQAAMVSGIDEFCQGRFPRDVVRGLAETRGMDRTLWTELAEMGVFGLVMDEADGGVGLGWADAVLVFEQLGRHLVPGPITSTFLAAPLVPGAATGDQVVTIVERADAPVMIEYLEASDVVLVLDEDGIWRMDPPADAVAMPVPLDPLTPVSRTGTLPGGDRIGDSAAAKAMMTAGVALTAALQLGLAAGATDLAVAYALDRRQFGKPIGQFQAVKHLCAEMATKVELARAAVYSAGVTLDNAAVGDASEAAAVAAIVASEAGDFCGKNCIQVHGGMGYTWEVDAHLFLKRSWVLDHAFGTVDDHAEALAARM